MSGRRSRDAIRFGAHHRNGKQPIAVAHYSCPDALVSHSGPAGVSTAAVGYTRDRIRQEVRFRGEAIRPVIGGGSATPSAVLGSLRAFVRAAERRLRLIVAGILGYPRVGPAVEAALPGPAGRLQWSPCGAPPGTVCVRHARTRDVVAPRFIGGVDAI